MSIARTLGVALLAGLTVLPRYGAAQTPPVYKTLHSFTGQDGDGAVPMTGPVIGTNQELYGTTSKGGAGGAGTVYELKPPASPGGDWTETVIYNFPSTSACCIYPNSLTLGADGAIYGTTTPQGNLDGVNQYNPGLGWGTVFELKPPAAAGDAWTETVIHSFARPGDGVAPYGALVMGTDGALYGTTIHGGTGPCLRLQGGDAGCGVVYQLTRQADGSWKENVLYSFTGQNGDGAYPTGVAIGAGGTLYGGTLGGGDTGFGTVFELQPPAAVGGAWTETVLHSFTDSFTDGGNADSTPVIGGNGALYGTTYTIAGNGAGSVFRLTPPAAPGGTWTEDAIFRSGGFSGGLTPNGLTREASGALFGTTLLGGIDCPTNGCGVVFELEPVKGGTWPETILHDFTGQNGDGATPYPFSILAIGANGAIFGTTTAGGSAGMGVVFEIDR